MPTPWDTGAAPSEGFNNGGNGVLGSMGGQANTPDYVYFGGSPDAANQMSSYYGQQAQAAQNAAAPTLGASGANAANRQMGLNTQAQQSAAGQNALAMKAQNTAMGNLQNAAAGNGPSAAQAQLQAGTDASINANMAMANSARGQAGLANAQKNAMTQNASTMQGASNQAAQLRAQEMQQAQGAFASNANQMQNQAASQQQGFGGQNLQGAGLLQQQDTTGANLQAQQNALNQQGNLGFQQLGFNAQSQALNAAQGNQNMALQTNLANAKNAGSTAGGILSAAGSVAGMFSDARVKKNVRDAGPSLDDALDKMGSYEFEYAGHGAGMPPGEHTGTMAQELASSKAGRDIVAQDAGTGALRIQTPQATSFALASLARLNERLDALEKGGKASESFGDAKLREPGGGAAWTLREEPDFLLAKNERTGQLQKVQTAPLSSAEHAQAMAPHGAGPISKTNGQYADMNLSSMMSGGSGASAPGAANGASGITSKIGAGMAAGAKEPAPAAYTPNQSVVSPQMMPSVGPSAGAGAAPPPMLGAAGKLNAAASVQEPMQPMPMSLGAPQGQMMAGAAPQQKLGQFYSSDMGGI